MSFDLCQRGSLEDRIQSPLARAQWAVERDGQDGDPDYFIWYSTEKGQAVLDDRIDDDGVEILQVRFLHIAEDGHVVTVLAESGQHVGRFVVLDED